MSCGNHHDTHCDEVLGKLYRFIDHEIDAASAMEIQQHLDECGPCLREHEVDLIVQRLVVRSCADRAPDSLRDRVRLTLHQVVQLDVQVDMQTETKASVRPPAQPTTNRQSPSPGGGLPWQPPGRF
jgi:mycothiol system anti-sigma-R factor